ncbi:DUF4199 domain-containing protein [Aquiflexum lacus]|uniref:DUF4199 domain-containing protein n=1 Tax=Aquiflexum lacus TaxID=2483805 RepID=UPI0018949056|nr:DUF4199 domain-containing protein [Aquiflexum lacus]
MNRYLESTYRFGLIGGLFCVFAFLMFNWLGYDPTNFSMLFGYVLIPIFVFLGIRYFKKDVNNGELSFANGMSIGFLIYTMIAFISGLGIWIILLIDISLFEAIKILKLEVLNTNKELIISQLSEESFEITLQKIMAMKPIDIALNDFIWKILPGLFFTIIISIILRKTKT